MDCDSILSCRYSNLGVIRYILLSCRKLLQGMETARSFENVGPIY